MKRFMILLMLLPCLLEAHDGPEMKVLGIEKRGSYICSLIEYGTGDGESVVSYLLMPDAASADNPCPGIVLLHDHGARFDIGKEKLVRPVAGTPENIVLSSEQWVRDNFDGVYLADSLASLGYAVIVPDMLYWGGRSTELCRRWSRMKFGGESGDIDSVRTAVYEGQREVYDSLYSAGEIWAEKTLREDAAAAAVLAGCGQVDKKRIAAVGWSMGAHRAWMLAAFCDLISSGVSVCWMTLKETVSLPYKASDYAMLIPRMREKYDFPDIARFLVPKPYCFLNGSSDRLFPVPASARAFEAMQEIYSENGCEGLLQTGFFDGGHHCGKEVQALVADFLEKTVPLQ